MSKKVLFVTASMQGGGTERVIAVLSDFFIKNGIDVTILMTASGEVAYHLNQRINVISLGGTTGGSIRKRLERICKMRCIFKEYAHHTIVSMGTETNLFSIIANMGLKGELVLSERNDPNQCSYAVLRDWLYAFGDYFVFQTEDARQCFSSKIQKQSVVIPNPINEQLPKPYIGMRRKVVAAVGRLTAQKNYPLLLHSFAGFVKSFPEYELHIYGVGENKGELEQLTDKLKIADKVQFCGFHADAIQRISDCSMYVLSSDYEGISNSLAEAMAMGMPVISTDCPIGGSQMCITNEVDGLLVPIKDIKALEEAMEKLASDVGMAEKMGMKATAIRERFSIEAVGRQWMKLIRE